MPSWTSGRVSSSFHRARTHQSNNARVIWEMGIRSNSTSRNRTKNRIPHNSADSTDGGEAQAGGRDRRAAASKATAARAAACWRDKCHIEHGTTRCFTQQNLCFFEIETCAELLFHCDRHGTSLVCRQYILSIRFTRFDLSESLCFLLIPVSSPWSKIITAG